MHMTTSAIHEKTCIQGYLNKANPFSPNQHVSQEPKNEKILKQQRISRKKSKLQGTKDIMS
jgi:hypothetical protein